MIDLPKEPGGAETAKTAAGAVVAPAAPTIVPAAIAGVVAKAITAPRVKPAGGAR